MMKWSRTLMLGGALIVLTNAVVMGGASYNRSGEAESRLHFTQRELKPEADWQSKEDSGLDLRLDWRIAHPDGVWADEYPYVRDWWNPRWLDKAKLQQLGFDVAALERSAGDLRRGDLQSREALLVLEFDGAAWRQALQQAEAYLDKARDALKDNPGKGELQRGVKAAEGYLAQERDKSSRLFVIDAGLDVQQLRARYPDRARYAIVRGLVQPSVIREGDDERQYRLGGMIGGVHADKINVPLEFREVLGRDAPFTADVAFGRRLEPWIAGAGKVAAGQ